MIALFLLASVALLLLGHLFRLLRWEQFIRIYERPARGNLLRGMAGGYTINFLLPFHVGDIFRALFCGRKMKSGTGFALATVIMDRFLDVWVVALCFGVFQVFGRGDAAVASAAFRYLVFALLLALGLVLVIALRDWLKKSVWRFVGSSTTPSSWTASFSVGALSTPSRICGGCISSVCCSIPC